MDRQTKARKLATLGHAIEALGFILIERELTNEEEQSLKQTLTWVKEILKEGR